MRVGTYGTVESGGSRKSRFRSGGGGLLARISFPSFGKRNARALTDPNRSNTRVINAGTRDPRSVPAVAGNGLPAARRRRYIPPLSLSHS